MFYDNAIEVRNKPIRKLSPDATDAEADEWKRQLDLLEESTPIFDVDNLFETLNPTLIEASNPAADTSPVGRILVGAQVFVDRAASRLHRPLRP
jgi:hypothetical protein